MISRTLQANTLYIECIVLFMNQKDLDQFQHLVQLLLKKEQDEPVAYPIPSQDLFDLIDLKLTDEGLSDEELYKRLEILIQKTPKTASKLFFNQLFAGRKSKAVLGDLIAVVLNTSMYTYKVAGPMVGVEKSLIQSVCDLIGFPKNAEGTITSGGSMSNFMAMVMAKDAYDAQIKHNGIQQKLIIYTSKECHYSIEKNAALAGIGRKQVRFIKTNAEGEMDLQDLTFQIKEDERNGFAPFFLNLTAGTTVLGAFDPIDAATEICRKHKLWMHVDGAYCGGIIFSQKYKRFLKGIEKADSFVLNGHKMLGTPMTCSILVTRDKKNLNDSFASEADYLFQSDDDSFNLGKTSFQCGRRNDALKLWTLWKSIGTKGMESLVNHQFDLANYARTYIKSNADYQLYSFDNSISVCFNYKGIDAKLLCEQLYRKGKILVSHGSSSGNSFVRLVTINSDNTFDDIQHFFETLEDFVKNNKTLLGLKSEQSKKQLTS